MATELTPTDIEVPETIETEAGFSVVGLPGLWETRIEANTAAVRHWIELTYGKPEPGQHHFTPRGPDGEKITMQINFRDWEVVQGWVRTVGAEFAVTDQLTGKKWRVRTGPCSLPNCYCECDIIEEVSVD